ncbi:helix-turn-helix transcriptional regulator [Sphingobium yanoikuyae]|uniref:helix-turn-helix transcriptional regulator n=1 Tax=Sphingobium yanoikuyae TaxID=13690 RepID=UPI003013F28C
MTMPNEADRLIPLAEVKELTGLGKTMIYRLIKAGEFPQQFKPGGYASRWNEGEVRAWREAQRAA